MPPIVDIHAHVFNHACLPIEGIVRARLLGAHVPGKTASFAAELLRRLVDILGELDGSVIRTTSDPDDDLERIARRVSDAFISGIEGDQDRYELLADIHVFLNRGDMETTISPNETGAAPQGTFSDEQIHGLIYDFFKELVKDCENGIRYLCFIFALLAPVERLWKRLQDEYKSYNVDVDLFVHLMMDMQPAYDEGSFCHHPAPKEPTAPPALDYGEQILQVARLTWQAHGKLAGFVAFDPRRSQALETVKHALDLGLVGVKIYPSMGFRPYDRRYRNNLKSFYEYCSQERVPVLAHCAAGEFQPFPGYGTYSNPGGNDAQGWDRVLESHPRLILCFAHTGEGHNVNFKGPCPKKHEKPVDYPGWYDACEAWFHTDSCWAPRILALCLEYEHTYCDLSFLPEIGSDTAKAEQVRKHLSCVLTSPDGPRFGRRLMYGCDWHMPEVIGRVGSVYSTFRSYFENSALQRYAPGFFGGNAVRFLNLGRRVERLRETLPNRSDDIDATLDRWEDLASRAALLPAEAARSGSAQTAALPTTAHGLQAEQGAPPRCQAVEPRCWASNGACLSPGAGGEGADPPLSA